MWRCWTKGTSGAATKDYGTACGRRVGSGERVLGRAHDAVRPETVEFRRLRAQKGRPEVVAALRHPSGRPGDTDLLPTPARRWRIAVVPAVLSPTPSSRMASIASRRATGTRLRVEHCGHFA